jgi:hypothetical protein
MPGKTSGPQPRRNNKSRGADWRRCSDRFAGELPGKLLAVSKISQYKKALVVFSGLY